MPADLIFVDDDRGVIFDAHGRVTGPEIIAASHRLYADPRFPGLRYQIIDRSACTRYEVSAAEISEVAELDRRAAYRNPGIRVAMVATNEHQVGSSRIYEARLGAGAFITRLFRSREEAEAWAREDPVQRGAG